ncbi:SDR family oxidoreductase [Aeromicrobium sp. YIM 150415]|uniref:SDR family oxidoreductase n=1 Tax=Aeromicrobium sp. YIM 150415 TaxID=2803912 RepID=UPI001963026C|nr:SDR family oxidoreductase [Aeromicrobium sp. YIM 150415]MBM9465284.1 SDR family oxidoreductase [Aeromicrobium sp. YIM 150415]
MSGARRAIVTGAAGGIGLAVARALVARGDRVVLADRDERRLAEAAADLGQPHLAADVATDDGIEALVALADLEMGGVDMYVANAGVFRGFGLESSEDDWATSLQVNTMAHVRAARALVPRWVDGDGGIFAVTASAAGLLTQLGSPTYSVSKHAAVGFAEWLAATYGDRGVQVCCLCPMGVRTPMVEGGQTHDDGDARLGHKAVATAGEVMEADDVAQVLLDAIDAKRFLALPHADVATMYARKAADPDRWLAGMQRYRTSLES